MSAAKRHFDNKRTKTAPKLTPINGDLRNKMIAKIKISTKHLDDDVYRLMLKSITGKDSCAKMTIAELEIVCKSLETKPTPSKKWAKRELTKSQKFIRALWIKGGQTGAVRNANDATLDALCLRLVKISKLEWVINHKHIQTLANAISNMGVEIHE